jgi:hypothetical protein
MEGNGHSVLFRCLYGRTEETHETLHLGEPVIETKSNVQTNNRDRTGSLLPILG